MKTVLVRKIDIWSLVRTIFPMIWGISAILIFVIFVIFGRASSAWMETYDLDAPDMGGLGTLAAIFISLFTGFISAAFQTMIIAPAIGIYNLLARVGGGIVLVLEEDEAPEPREPNGGQGATGLQS